MAYFLSTVRLALRPLEDKDMDILYDYRNDDRCAKFQRGQITDREGILSMIRQEENCTLFQASDHRIAIVSNETDELVGDIKIMFQDTTITLGYTISYHHHRKGYAFEILSALVLALHQHFLKHEVICLVEPENTASTALLQKLEFEYLGYAPAITSKVYGKWAHPDENEGLV